MLKTIKKKKKNISRTTYWGGLSWDVDRLPPSGKSLQLWWKPVVLPGTTQGDQDAGGQAGRCGLIHGQWEVLKGF